MVIAKGFFRCVFNWVHQHSPTIKRVGKILTTSSIQEITSGVWAELWAVSQKHPHSDCNLLVQNVHVSYLCLQSCISSSESTTSKDDVNGPHLCVWRGRGRHSDCVGVVGRKCVQVAQLTKAALDVCHVDLNIVLEATRNREKEVVKTWRLN